MKKVLMFGVCILCLTACKASPAGTPQTTSTPSSDTGAANDFSAIAQAQSSGQPVSCTIAKTDGSTSMMYAMKGKKMKITGMKYGESTQDTTIISDGQFMYTWDTTTKKGMKFTVPSESDVKDMAAKQGQPVPALKTEEDKKKFEDQGYTVKCAVSDISDSDFVPPTDVTFTDASAMMEQSKVMMQKSPSPANAQSQAEMEKQAQEMMKQYQNK